MVIKSSDVQELNTATSSFNTPWLSLSHSRCDFALSVWPACAVGRYCAQQQCGHHQCIKNVLFHISIFFYYFPRSNHTVLTDCALWFEPYKWTSGKWNLAILVPLVHRQVFHWTRSSLRRVSSSVLHVCGAKITKNHQKLFFGAKKLLVSKIIPIFALSL